MTFNMVVMPKLLLDELVLVINGSPFKEHQDKIIFYAGISVLLPLVLELSMNIIQQLLNVFSEWFGEYFQTELSSIVMEMDYEHTENPKVLEQLNLAKEGLNYSGGAIGVLDQFYYLIKNIVILFGVSMIILITCPLLIPIQICSLLMMAYFNGRNNRIEIEGYKKMAKINRVFGYYFFQLADYRYGKDIRLYDSADMMCRKADAYTKEMTATWKEQAKKERRNNYGFNFANALRDGLSYFYIGVQALKKVITIGDFSMCVSGASKLYGALSGLVSSCQCIVKWSNYFYQYIKFAEYPKALVVGTKSVLEGQHEICFENVSFQYPRSEEYVLRNVNLCLKQGEHLSLVGLNGAGKTTMVKLLCRMYDVTEGRITLDGVDIREYATEEYRKIFAVVFQDFRLFAFSLKENIAFSKKARKEQIEKVLKLSGFYEDALELPEGLDTMLFKSFDENGTELSGGQKQKVAISRALYRDAPIVILDEPTAALDPLAEYDIYCKFHELVRNKTAIYISHRLSSCKFCDRIAVFANGTIKEYGTHEELVNLPGGIYATMFEAQAQYYR